MKRGTMIIGGLQKFSLLDYPDHLSAIIFTQGCNFRCQFCYNPMLVLPPRQNAKSGFGGQELGKVKNIASPQADEAQKDRPEIISEDDLFAFLRSRIGKLDAVVISGGEPTIHGDIAEFISKIKRLNYKIKLDTNGTNPSAIQNLLNKALLDYIAMDIKAPGRKYDLIAGVQPDLDKIRQSIRIIINSGRPHEFRTTVVPELIQAEDTAEIGELIKGAEKWYLQQFKSEIDLVNNSFKGAKPYDYKILEKMKKIGGGYVGKCEIR